MIDLLPNHPRFDIVFKSNYPPLDGVIILEADANEIFVKSPIHPHIGPAVYNWDEILLIKAAID